MKDLQELSMKKDSNIYKRGWKDYLQYIKCVNQKKISHATLPSSNQEPFYSCMNIYIYI